MKKLMVSILSVLMVCVMSLDVSAAISSKTLPKGVWKFDMAFNNYDIEKAGVNKTGTSSDLETWESITLSDGTMRDIPNFRDLNTTIAALNGVNLDTKLLKQWNKKQFKFDVAYGLNDKLTLFSNIIYENAFIDYTDEYVAETKRLNTLVHPTIGAGFLDDQITVAPDKATSSSLRDIFVGAKYNIKENLSVVFKGSFGPLRIGVAPSEKKQEDGKQELETGTDHDIYQFLAFYDMETKYAPLHLMAGYTILGKGLQRFLDNKKVAIDLGDIIVLGVGSDYAINDKLSVNGSLTYLIHGKDQYKGGKISGVTGTDSYQDVPKSDGTALLADLQLNYKHKEFLKFFVGTNLVLANDKKGQIYAFPGRLEPGMMLRLGTTLFYK